MRKDFFDYMLKIMEDNPDVYLIFIGLGYPRYDEFKEKFGDRAINTDAAEQTALDIAVGLAYEGKIPFIYTITPFYWRAAETIRTYISHENLHVVMCGAGRNDDYGKDDGFSHDGTDIKKLMSLPNIESLYPDTLPEMQAAVLYVLKTHTPTFISLRR